MLKLGQKVSFNTHVTSNHVWSREKNQYGYDWSIIRKVVERIELPKPKFGIVAGVRVLKEGEVRGGHYDDDPTYLDQTRTVKVYLVAADLRGFYRVLPEDIVSKEESPYE